MTYSSYFKKIIPIKTTAVMTKGTHIGQPAIAEPTKSKAKTTPAIFSNTLIASFPIFTKLYSCKY